MSRINADFVGAMARVWHRFEPPNQDLDTLAAMLAPMDDAGEVVAEEIEFDMEPSDYLAGLGTTADAAPKTDGSAS